MRYSPLSSHCRQISTTWDKEHRIDFGTACSHDKSLSQIPHRLGQHLSLLRCISQTRLGPRGPEFLPRPSSCREKIHRLLGRAGTILVFFQEVFIKTRGCKSSNAFAKTFIINHRAQVLIAEEKPNKFPSLRRPNQHSPWSPSTTKKFQTEKIHVQRNREVVKSLMTSSVHKIMSFYGVFFLRFLFCPRPFHAVCFSRFWMPFGRAERMATDTTIKSTMPMGQTTLLLQ